MTDRRDEYVPHPLLSSSHSTEIRGRHFTESISALHSTSIQLASRPETHTLYNLRLYPISLERSALLAQYAFEENHALESVQTAYEEERERVEEEWRKGRDRIRERLLEGIEERRRRAREEKEGEGTVNGTRLSHLNLIQLSLTLQSNRCNIRRSVSIPHHSKAPKQSWLLSSPNTPPSSRREPCKWFAWECHAYHNRPFHQPPLPLR